MPALQRAHLAPSHLYDHRNTFNLSHQQFHRVQILRGGELLKAIALGARAVVIGKVQGWGLAAAGQAGLLRVLEIIACEIDTTI
jgi:hypothetical protein